MIQVEVALFATLKRYQPEAKGADDTFQVSLPPESTLRDLLNILQIPAEESKQAFVDNRRQDWDYTLKGGERVAIFPPIAGG